MLKLLLKDAIRTPWKLLALCFVVYLASMSFMVFFFLAAMLVHWARQTVQKHVKALAAAEAEAQRAESAAPVAPVTPAANPAQASTASAASPAESKPKRQYAKSAVVIPLRTGTRD